MNDLVTHAAWVLSATFALAFVYELWRATAKAGVSRHDNMKVFATQGLATYVVAGAVIATLFAGFSWAPWLALLFTAAIILVSIFYYNPKIMLERQPGAVDWIEDLVFTGGLFVAAALLAYHLADWRLTPALS
ncbi:MAG: hypothetical protein H2041_12285 [Phenylobacterium sp.]|uniref:hypothetical protein n=1 Tax=Phenylobacterium sp. TaxID=1871053 RepID=UPI0017EDAAEB|nr:hypothetical protein [Phenylobacterium sp.]MBA4794436.1 hypothetical protein [Phenylobacterium sp.]